MKEGEALRLHDGRAGSSTVIVSESERARVGDRRECVNVAVVAHGPVPARV